MRNTLIAIVVGLVTVCSASSAACAQGSSTEQRHLGPSFPCPSPHDPLAQLICSSPDLSEADLRYVQAYQALGAQLGPSGQSKLRQEGVAFDKTVRSQCGIGPPDSGTTASSSAIPCVLRRYMAQRNLLADRLTGTAAEEAARPLQSHVALQANLKALGFLPSDATVDGVYGPATRTAILQWQQSQSRPLTGFLGNSDAAFLEQQVASIATPLASTDHNTTELGPPAPRPQATTAAPATTLGNKQDLLQRVMNEFYGSYSKEHSCWISNHEEKTYCMNPVHIEIVGSGANKKIFIAVGGQKLDNDGQPEACHACTGALGLIVLAEHGSQFKVVAKNDLFENFGSWGSAPGRDAFAVRELGPHGSYGCLITTEYDDTGEATVGVSVYGVLGDRVVSLDSVTTRNATADDGCSERGDRRCTDISGDLVIDANSQGGTFYPLVLRASGVRQGRPFRGTYRFAFDEHAIKYVAPKNLPDELK